MSPKDFKDLIKLMRAQGVTRYKTADIEIDLAQSAPPKARRKSRKSDKEEAEIKHKLEQMKSVMALGDDELLDRLFPLPKEDEQQETQ